MFGGINNPALFNVNDRMARDKLSMMAGIMASSTELLNSQLNNPMRAMPQPMTCLLYTSPSPRDRTRSRMPSSA